MQQLSDYFLAIIITKSIILERDFIFLTKHMKVIKILTLSILIAVFSLGYTAHFFTKSVDFVKCENMAGNKESCHKALSQKEIVKSCDCCADNYLSSYISDQSYIEEIYFAFTQNLFTLRTDELESVYLVSLSRPPKTL